MSEVFKKCVDAADKTLAGQLPLDTAHESSRLFYTAVMDTFATDREARRIGEKEKLEKLEEGHSAVINRPGLKTQG